MPETTPLPNDPVTRTPEGEILNQTQTQTSSPPEKPNEPAPTTEAGAPADYTAFTAPEGATLDPKSIESATAIFKELGLSQSQAQRLVDYQLGRDTELSGKSAETYNQMRTDWRKQVETHPTLGGQKLDETKAEIGKAIASLPSKLQADFKDAMNLTGAGDHPAVVEAFYTLAKQVNEGQHVSGNGPGADGQTRPGTEIRPSRAAAMFPNLPTSAPH